MNIGDLLAERKDKTLRVISPQKTLQEAARKMLAHSVGSLVVTDQFQNPIGIITERDLMRAIQEEGENLVKKPVSALMTRVLRTCTPEDGVGEVLVRMKQNSIRHLPVMTDGKLSAVVSIRDLTHAYEVLKVQADTDPLTGLSNRRHFFDILQKEVSRCQRYGRMLSLAIIDADNFKRINDTYGHDTGDKVLKELANLLLSEFRNSDWIGRLGGEEFAVVFPETGLAGAELACERLLGKIRTAEIAADNMRINFTVSIGVAELVYGMKQYSTLVKRADQLMYLAKAAGGNQIATERFGSKQKNGASVSAVVN